MLQKFPCLTRWIGLACSFIAIEANADFTLDEIVAGMAFERGKIKSGDFLLSGSKTIELFSGELELVDFEERVIFDLPRDATLLLHEGVIEDSTESGFVLKDVRMLKCRTKAETFHYNSTAPMPHIFITAPNETSYSGIGGDDFPFFDPRAVGLVGYDSMHALYDLSDLMEDVSARFADGFSVAIYEGGIARIRKVYGDTTKAGNLIGVTDFLVDVESGFVLNRMEVSSHFATGTGGQLVPASQYFRENPPLSGSADDFLVRKLVRDVERKVDVGWQEIDGVWVPTSINAMALEQKFDKTADGKLDPESARLIEHTFGGSLTWNSVNAPIASDRFSYKKFDVPGGTLVFDARGDEPFLVGQVGSRQPYSQISPTTSLTAIVIAGLAILAFFIWRRGAGAA
ncbi:hypothetical protein [Crateriforma conspicua]|uniref:hypothetical protein n=1 Tax=Crateriforma conspicua TaxID=2527996 RepID=UPI001187E2E2|nr:hypothetical protein [Crateriforma conspicua]QDV62003.1 hypothetical protein Mal65_11310 [Crateriforma conspicua]